MFNSIRCLCILAMLAPAMVLAQQKAPVPCAPAAPELSDLAVQVGLPDLPELPEMSELSELKVLAMVRHDVKEVNCWQEDASATSFEAEKRRTIEKTFKVNISDRLNIENKFGKVHVNTWDKKEIHVKIDIVARAGSEQNAQRILDGIRILESRVAKDISFRTETESMRMSGNSNRSFEINYTIIIPEGNPIAVKNSFGDVYLADLKGKADVTVKYGSLKTNNLNNPANTIKLAYGSGNCGFINQGNIDVAYSNLQVEGTNGLQGSSKFSDLKIGNLGEELAIDVKYGSFRVDNISRNIRKINVASGFSPISLNFADNTAFNFDVNVQFANFKFDKSHVNITSLEKGHTSAEYKGQFGGTSPKGSVSIVSKYGDVKFTK